MRPPSLEAALELLLSTFVGSPPQRLRRRITSLRPPRRTTSTPSPADHYSPLPESLLLTFAGKPPLQAGEKN